MAEDTEQKDKTDPEKEKVTELWRSYLTGDTSHLNPMVMKVRSVFRRLPSDPRCHVCSAPFGGVGSKVLSLAGFGGGRSIYNPGLCDRCEKIVRKHQVGAEVQLTLLFADVRGSTTLAEESGASAYHQLINRFYSVSTDVLVKSGAMIDKLAGDSVIGLYVPGIAGPEYARRAVEAARALLEATGHTDPHGPWIQVGAGVHTGMAYLGAVGSSSGMSDITVLGDAANTAARLSSAAGPGEILVSEATCRQAGMDLMNICETRTLQLKGRSKPVEVRVLRVAPDRSA